MTVPLNRNNPLFVIVKTMAVFAVALLVTVTLFLFMQNLIHSDAETFDRVELSAVVELYQEPPKPDEIEPEPDPEPIVEATEEPQMESPTEAPVEQPAASADQIMPSVDMGSLAMNIGSSVGDWTVPLSGKAMGELNVGEDNKGYVEVVPYSTRKPDIPLLAWQNKVNGWVLVVFSISSKGYTNNIRVLDASPKGIFEEEVKKAVAGWRYDVRSISNYSSGMLVTQKVELYWKDYPENSTRY